MLYNPKYDLSEVSKKLLDAADLLEEKGWIQNSYQNDNGYCVLGAISQVTTGKPDWGKYCNLDENFDDLKSKCSFYIKSFLNEHPGDWNDNSKRTKKEVIDMLRKAAYMNK